MSINYWNVFEKNWNNISIENVCHNPNIIDYVNAKLRKDSQIADKSLHMELFYVHDVEHVDSLHLHNTLLILLEPNNFVKNFSQ